MKASIRAGGLRPCCRPVGLSGPEMRGRVRAWTRAPRGVRWQEERAFAWCVPLKGFGGGRRAAEERLAECVGEHVVEIEMQLAEEAYAGAAFAGDRDGRFQSDLKV